MVNMTHQSAPSSMKNKNTSGEKCDSPISTKLNHNKKIAAEM